MDWEAERIKTELDLRIYATSKGYELDLKESWAGSAVMRHPSGDKIIIKRDSDGHFVYFSVRDDADNGTAFDFTQRRLNCSFGAARKELRAFMSLPAPLFVPYAPLAPVAKDRIGVERAYARMQVATRHPYLENERGIPQAILESRRFAGRIRIDHRGNAVFPHYDRDGLSGFEIKNHGYTSFAKGGSKGLWTSHVEHLDNRLVIAESAIDALSHAALFPDARARYASISGRPTPAQRELIRGEAAVLPESSTVVAAMDADAAGRELAELVLEAARKADRPDVRFETHVPASFKDWNEQLCAAKRASARLHSPEARPA
ncbi:MAG TPA: DUF3991 domain-containing protein [Bryobacteraceae bacterium]|nr:DUF3991 domain-containing protein [Bryobacteraceae bacterium]